MARGHSPRRAAPSPDGSLPHPQRSRPAYLSGIRKSGSAPTRLLRLIP